MLSSEVLPAPFGPMIDRISPRRTMTETSSTARTPPNRFDTPEIASCTSVGAVPAPAIAWDTSIPTSPPSTYCLCGLIGGHDAERAREWQQRRQAPFSEQPQEQRRAMTTRMETDSLGAIAVPAD